MWRRRLRRRGQGSPCPAASNERSVGQARTPDRFSVELGVSEDVPAASCSREAWPPRCCDGSRVDGRETGILVRVFDTDPPQPQDETLLHKVPFTAKYRSHPRIDWSDASGRYTRMIEGRV